MTFQQTGFALVEAHLDTARRDPDYKFVLAEVDYLKPVLGRAARRTATYIRRLLDEGRLEIMGGTYNEPNTNLTTRRDDRAELRLRRRLPAAAWSAATRAPRGSSTCSATTRSSRAWRPTPG